MSTQQNDALQCAADFEYSIPRHRIQDAFILNAYKALKMVRTQHARITELESQLAQRFDAADMSTASAQGFRDGWTAAQAISAEPAGATEMENLQRTAVGWQERALRAERNWVVCRRWAIAGGAPVEKLGDDPDQPFHAASPAIEGESNV